MKRKDRELDLEERRLRLEEDKLAFEKVKFEAHLELKRQKLEIEHLARLEQRTLQQGQFDLLKTVITDLLAQKHK